MLFIFDMGGVVTSTFKMDSIYKKLNITKEIFFTICKYANNDIWHKLETGMIDTNTFWKIFNENVEKIQRNNFDEVLKLGKHSTDSNIQNIPVVKNDLFRLFFHPDLNTKTAELINALKKKHRVVCGTNTIQSHWENHLERGDYAFFHQTYASNKIGEAKPNPEFFKLILEAEEYDAKDAFFTDDKIENIQAAKSLGINTELCISPDNLYSKWIKYAD